ncbi:anhydro-N-acetylmuramic acid kinase [Spiribacter vilamensis]|nr:anhydro-N-acetylmuramic acid kinase [Spiribacter vilamensis]
MIGLMSGTSLDGVDAALVDFDARGRPTLAGQIHHDYPAELAAQLRTIDGDSPLRTVLMLDAWLAGFYASAVEALRSATGTARQDIDGIALHGQTLWHAPGASPPVTCQIGDPSRLAETTGIPVIADFRQRDLAAGGEGAPLAPLFHAALFGCDHRRCVVNIGGVANISVLDAGGQPLSGFDAGPGNTLMDAWARRHLDLPFDRDGRWAASGMVDTPFLERLLADPYFRRPPPKSIDIRTFDLAWLEKHSGAPQRPADIQATLLALTAVSIVDAIDEWGKAPEDVVITGGGALNTELRRAIAARLTPRPLLTGEDEGIPATLVEATGFAWLGRATLRGDRLDLRSITGARRPVILGGVYPA